MYVNLGIPLKLENPLSEDDAIFAEDNVQYKWNLYVPKGSKSVYASDGSQCCPKRFSIKTKKRK